MTKRTLPDTIEFLTRYEDRRISLRRKYNTLLFQDRSISIRSRSRTVTGEEIICYPAIVSQERNGVSSRSSILFSLYIGPSVHRKLNSRAFPSKHRDRLLFISREIEYRSEIFAKERTQDENRRREVFKRQTARDESLNPRRDFISLKNY